MKVNISDLKVTSEDVWMDEWLIKTQAKVEFSPQYQYLKGNPIPMVEWMNFREMPVEHLSKKIIEILVSLIKIGQQEPIKIYRDKRINTGHKRAACLLYLGKREVEAEIVGDDYPL